MTGGHFVWSVETKGIGIDKSPRPIAMSGGSEWIWSVSEPSIKMDSAAAPKQIAEDPDGHVCGYSLLMLRQMHVGDASGSTPVSLLSDGPWVAFMHAHASARTYVCKLLVLIFVHAMHK